MAPFNSLTRFFGALPRYAIGHPKRVVAGALLFTLLAVPGLGRLTLRTDGHALVDQSAPEIVFDRAIREEFGIEDAFVVLIRSQHTNGIFNPNTLQLVRELSTEFARVEGVQSSNLVSLATERGLRFRPRTAQLQTFLETPRQTKAELDQLKGDLKKIRIYDGTLVSYDGRATVILVGAPASQDRTRIYRHLRDIIAAKGKVAEEISVIGAPAAETLLGLHILEDLGVPTAWLGTGRSTSAEAGEWRVPRSWHELRLLVARRVGLVPVSILVMALIFFLSFRSLTATMLPLMEVGACLVFVFGLMGMTGVPIYLTIAVMPVILTAMGVTDEIYIFSRYVELLRQHPGTAPPELVGRTMEELWRPVVNMAATTAIGFLSFALSPLGPVRAFGIFTAVGLLFCMVWSLMVIPALLVLVKPAWLIPRRSAQRTKAAQSSVVLTRFARATVRHRYVVLVTVLVALVLTPLGIRRVVVQDSWVDGFDPASEFYRETRYVNEHFHGAHILLVSVDAGHLTRTGELAATDMSDRSYRFPADLVKEPQELVGSWLTFYAPARTNAGASPALGRPSWSSWVESAIRRDGKLEVTTPYFEGAPKFSLKAESNDVCRFELVSQRHLKPALLREIEQLGAFIQERRQYRVGGVLSAADYLKTTRIMLRLDTDEFRRIPDDPQELRNLWGNYGDLRGAQRLRQAVDTNYARSILTVFLKDANFVDTGKLMQDIRAFERERLATNGVRLNFAGDVAVSQSLIASIVSTQVQSLVSSLVGILLVVSVLGRSLRAGIYCVVPSVVAVLINFAVMGWMGMPLGIATSMFAGMTLGMGVDFSIHLLERFQFVRERGQAVSTATVEAVAGVGPAVMLNALGVAVGFSVLIISQVPANARLGALVVLGVVNCLVATLLVLPVLLSLWPPKGPTGVKRTAK